MNMASCLRPHLSIDSWLEKLDLLLYRHIFKEYDAVEDILWMSEKYLKELGIKNGGHRAQIISSLTILRDKYIKFSREGFDASSVKSTILGSEKLLSSQVKLERQHSGARSWPSSVPSSSPHSNQSSPRLSMDVCCTDISADELKQALERELKLDSSDLRSHAWYHGTILRQRAEELVVRDGDFLVRDCISQPGDFVITSKWTSVPLHFIIRKIVQNPDKLYERIQYCFEKETFDTIQDFITYYAGGKQVLSESSGVILSHPINRTMPLSYYTSRFGVQCQMHYAAKKLESLSLNKDSVSALCLNSQSPLNVENTPGNRIKSSFNVPKSSPVITLTRVSSDIMLIPSTQHKNVEQRPHSGSFSEIKPLRQEVNKPPPKPSRVPSKKYVIKTVPGKLCVTSTSQKNHNGHNNDFQCLNSSKHKVTRKPSETRFSFLDRPSISEDILNSNNESASLFTLPPLDSPSIFDPQMFSSDLLNRQNLPLEGTVLSKVKEMILSVPSNILACHMTWKDLDAIKNTKEMDFGLGVTNGLELLFLPQGEQLNKDLIERTECLKLFIAITLLTTPFEQQRVELLKKWIDIAIETRTNSGNLFGFTSIMLGLTIPEIAELHSTWLSLRHTYTDSAFAFETKLRPALTALQQASGTEAPNICLPYLLTLIVVLQQHKNIMALLEEDIFEERINEQTFLNLEFPGCVNTSDYGLQLLADHLENGRYIMQQYPVFLQNGKIAMQKIKLEKSILDIFSTEFHLRILWGFRGAIVDSKERHEKFQKVLFLLHSKCLETLF